MKTALELIREAYTSSPDLKHYWDNQSYDSDDLARLSMLRACPDSQEPLYNALYVYEKHKGLVDVEDPVENMILAATLMILALESRLREHGAIEADDHETEKSEENYHQ